MIGAKVHPEVTAARAEVTEAMAAFVEAQKAMNLAIARVSAAEVAEQQAMLKADESLPRIVVTYNKRHSPSTHEEFVISRRTPKSMTVRRPGSDHEIQFRPNKYDPDRWDQYPSCRSVYPSSWTTIDMSGEKKP